MIVVVARLTIDQVFAVRFCDPHFLFFSQRGGSP